MTKNKLIEHPMSNEFVIDGFLFYNFNECITGEGRFGTRSSIFMYVQNPPKIDASSR